MIESEGIDIAIAYVKGSDCRIHSCYMSWMKKVDCYKSFLNIKDEW